MDSETKRELGILERNIEIKLNSLGNVLELSLNERINGIAQDVLRKITLQFNEIKNLLNEIDEEE